MFANTWFCVFNLVGPVVRNTDLLTPLSNTLKGTWNQGLLSSVGLIAFFMRAHGREPTGLTDRNHGWFQWSLKGHVWQGYWASEIQVL